MRSETSSPVMSWLRSGPHRSPTCPTSLLSLAFVCCAAIGYADNYPRQPGVDAQHYVFRIALSDTSDEIAGEATADLRFVQAGVTQVVLDLTSVKDGKGMIVESVTDGGTPVKYDHTAD